MSNLQACSKVWKAFMGINWIIIVYHNSESARVLSILSLMMLWMIPDLASLHPFIVIA